MIAAFGLLGLNAMLDMKIVEEISGQMLGNLLAAESCDRERAEQAVSRLYEHHDLEPPRFFLWYPSPAKALLASMLCAWTEGVRITLKPDQSPSAMILYALDAAGRSVLMNLDLHETSFCYSQRFLDVSAFWFDRTHEVFPETNVLRQAGPSLRNAISQVARLELEEKINKDARFTFWQDLFGEILSCVNDSHFEWQFQRATELLMRLEDRQHRYTLNNLHRFMFSAGSEQNSVWNRARMRFGQHEADLIARYKIMQMSGIAVPASIALHEEIVRSCGWFAPFQSVCVMVERPTEIHLNTNGLVARENQPACRYEDSWQFYSLGGIPVPGWIATGDFQANRIDEMRNIELRRAMIERYGLVNYLKDTQAQLSGEDRFGRLHRKVQRNDEDIVLLEVKNATAESDGSFKTYFLRVPPHVTTPKEAVAWTFGLLAEQYEPDKET